jgi:ketosteroid isomerase-like protein
MAMSPIKRNIIICVLLLFVTVACTAQTSETNEQTPLYKEIAKMDSLMFDAFNKHDIEKLMSFFSEDLEFYHDKGGLSNYKENEAALKKLFLQSGDIKRELIQGSMEVYPIAGYGAILVGKHKFCHEEKGKEECGVFKFTNIWKKINNEWKVTRVISYDH